MFEIVEQLLLEFVDMLGWFIPVLIAFIFIGHLIRRAK